MTVVFNEDYIISQFEGFDELKVNSFSSFSLARIDTHHYYFQELDWKMYKEKYGNIQRLDRILGSEGDTTDNYQVLIISKH